MIRRQKILNIFISHHHSDAVNLVTLKNYFINFGFECFLAPKDIEPGEIYLNVIEDHLRKCDVFLYIGSKSANESSFCQQEIGMAKGLKKPIISTMTRDCPPRGFIMQLQSQAYTLINDDFIRKILKPIWKGLLHTYKINLITNKIQQSLNCLSIDGFSTDNQTNTIFLKLNKWNDFNYMTKFTIYIRNLIIGYAKITYLEQEENIHISEKLPNFFPFIDPPFFSLVRFDNALNLLSKIQKDAILYLLNDVTLMAKNDLANISSEKVYVKSLNKEPW